ncbi:MAG: helix-turn-helix domain-containing protein [Moraxella sp.]|nr:helix-turn-helix domain-containing protein [Moraxella sp.]
MNELGINELNKGRVLSKDCPSRLILNHLTSRWGVLVMIVLKDGTKRFSEIRREIEGVSERMLSETLKQLEADGMLVRKSYNTVPPHTDYTLTDYGRQAGERIYALVDWLENNLCGILATQA